MTDLEIIRVEIWAENKITTAVKNRIMEAATRMSERIGELERENANLAKFLNLCDYCKKEFATCDSQTNGLDWGTGKGNDNVVKCIAFEGGRNLYDEISRLKSVLTAAKVVTCGECEKHETQECRMANWDEVYMQYTTGCAETDFCSKAVRKEPK